jgi:hypothetical protein
LAFAAAPVGALGRSSAATAQTGPALKSIGVASNAKRDTVPSSIVMNSRGATLQGDTLTLIGISPNSIIFADRPVRSAGHALTAHLLEEWSPGSDSFAKDPQNATVSVFNKGASVVKDAVVELTSPKMDGDNLNFNVNVLEGDIAGADGPASVFIDIIGLPRTPLSVAGVGRRTAYRAAFYGAAAVEAHPYGGYAYGYPPPAACGYHPYPPCH